MIIAERKAFRERVKLGLTALPLIQVAGLTTALLDLEDFPFHIRVDL
jgi:hypothetical protein